MSQGIGHFSFGVGITTAFLLATGAGKKIKNTEPIRIAGGLWAMGPDISKLVPSLRSLHDSWWADFFWLHRLIDNRIDPNDTAFISAIFLAFMLLTLAIHWRIVSSESM